MHEALSYGPLGPPSRATVARADFSPMTLGNMRESRRVVPQLPSRGGTSMIPLGHSITSSAR